MKHSFLFTKDKQLKTSLSVKEISDALKDKSCMIWVDFEKPDDIEIEMLLNVFNLHPLTIEDCIMPNARPKAEHFPDYLFVVLHAIGRHSQAEEIEMMELDIILGKNFIVTVHNAPIPSIEAAEEKVKKSSPIMTKGPDFLMHSISDSLVDNYFPMIDKLDNKIDLLEDRLFGDESEDVLQEIFHLKNEIMVLRRSVGPQRDVINRFTRSDFSPMIKATTSVYFRDVYDHLVRMNDLLDSCRDSLTGSIDIYVSNASNRMNHIVKTLTIITTIFMPLTLITGIYGMNFRYMPELETKFGYLGVWIAMAIISIFMLIVFKRRKWM